MATPVFTLFLVETTCSSYLCSAVDQTDTKIILTSAFRFNTTDKQPAQQIAKDFVRTQLEGRLRTITISTKTFESSHEADEEIAGFITGMLTLLPLARKRAEVDAVMNTLVALLTASE